MENSDKLVGKLAAIANGFRSSRGTTQEYSLDEMATLAAEPVGGSGDGKNVAVALLQGELTEITDENFPGMEIIVAGYGTIERVDHSLLRETGSFRSSGRLVSFSAPNLTTFLGKSNNFRDIGPLTSFIGGDVVKIVQSCFESSGLKYAEFKSVGTIEQWAFWGAPIETLVIRGDNVTTIATKTAFDGTPFSAGGSGGTVYVKSALIEQYKSATNWAALYEGGSCNFVALEGSEYE